MKYVALTLISLAAALLVLASAVIGNSIGIERRALPPPMLSLPNLSPQAVLDQAELKVALRSLLDISANRPAELMVTPVTPGLRVAETFDSLFAQSRSVPTSPARAGKRRPTVAAIPRPKVSVVMEGPQRKAVVDGLLVKEGDKVGDDLTVLAIGMESVTFAYGKEELRVAVPLERLRVLGALPTPAKDIQ